MSFKNADNILKNDYTEFQKVVKQNLKEKNKISKNVDAILTKKFQKGNPSLNHYLATVQPSFYH